jgi:hypothetical protein
MSRSLTIAEFGRYAGDKIEKLLREVVLETDQRLKMASPVDTGRFRMSWAVGEDNARFDGVPPGDYRGQMPQLRAIGYIAGQERLGHVYSVHNNLPYAEPLADGHSAQAPRGWVENIANDIRTRARDAAERIAREP